MKLMIATLSLVGVANGLAQTTQSPANLHEDLRTLARVVSVSKDLAELQPVLRAILDEDIEKLRDPRGDGTYRWASLQREEESRITEEKGIDRVSTESDLQSVSVSAPRAYRLLITAPAKRNLVSSNSRIFIRNTVVDSLAFDAEGTRREFDVNVWINPGESHGIALPDIGRIVKATVWLGVESGNRKAAVNVALLQAKLVDDPASPNYPAVRRLLDVRRRAMEDDVRKGDLAAAIDEALLSLPGEMERRRVQTEDNRTARSARAQKGTLSGSIRNGDATPDVVAAIEDIARLTAGTLEQQQLARVRLQDLIELLKPAYPRSDQ